MAEEITTPFRIPKEVKKHLVGMDLVRGERLYALLNDLHIIHDKLRWSAYVVGLLIAMELYVVDRVYPDFGDFFGGEGRVLSFGLWCFWLAASLAGGLLARRIVTSVHHSHWMELFGHLGGISLEDGMVPVLHTIHDHDTRIAHKSFVDWALRYVSNQRKLG